MEPAIFLDRDNTLISNDGDLGDPDVVYLLGGVSSGLQALCDAGYRLIVVTNQGGVARGVFTEADVDAVNQRIATLVDDETNRSDLIDRFYYCPYHPDAKIEEYKQDHPWRKPNPGMLLQAAHDMHLDLGRSWMVGDQARDIKAGCSAGCRTALVSGAVESIETDVRPTIQVETFAEAVQAILKVTPNLRKETGPETQRKNSEGEKSSPRTVLAPPESIDPVESEITSLRRVIHDLTDELRSERMRRAEFTPTKMAAVIFQLLVVLLALLGLLQVGNTEIFTKWMLGAGLMQLLAITLLLVDLRG